ncbi:S1 family peptidase [Mycolicibacter heraklionensis]|uniref:S1 family peptidase n=1 Tax=Mycolicibacter heraklionensis TaxID=512402 RepID=UPI00069B525A|nr:S1 family peptidase [Mycolicibacter heraklionensis]
MAAFRRLPLKTLLTRLGFAALAITVLAGIVWATRAQPVRQLIPLPAAEAIGPGVGINISSPGSAEATSCTAGFLVRTKDGRPGLLSAGHCNKPGGSGTVAIHHGALYPTVGAFTESVYDGKDGNNIGLITLDDPDKFPLTPEIDGHPVSGVADRVEIGDTLCHLGVRTGEPVCGPVAASEKNKVRFAAAGTCGDSGGPAYRMRPDGTAEAVGILTAEPHGEDPETACAEPHESSVAQLIKPWLQAWQLTLVTTA